MTNDSSDDLDSLDESYEWNDDTDVDEDHISSSSAAYVDSILALRLKREFGEGTNTIDRPRRGAAKVTNYYATTPVKKPSTAPVSAGRASRNRSSVVRNKLVLRVSTYSRSNRKKASTTTGVLSIGIHV
jgi:hypothetical protein